MSIEELGREQQYVSMLYGRLDDLRAQLSARLAQSRQGEPGGTHQARMERDAAAARYAEQIAQYNAVDNGLCFGRIDLAGDAPDGVERRYIGRIGLFDEDADYEPLLVDWRAPAARPFYVATAASPDGVRMRRHIRTARREVVGLDDEVLDLSAVDPTRSEGLTGEAALLAAVNAGRTGRMHDIVSTIQAEQDRIIRCGLAGALVVQGGPGTGKTAVALHRAAYLLYTYRRQLAPTGVLVIGPNTTFLRYIGQVLPSLGETSVVLKTIADLYPGIRARRAEPLRIAEIKGRIAMADAVAAAVQDRQQVPDDAREIKHEDQTLLLDRETCLRAQRLARKTRRPHNQARPVFVDEILASLAQQHADQLTENILAGGLVEGGAFGEIPLVEGEVDDVELLDAADVEEIRRELAASETVRAVLDDLWPQLTPQRLLADLFACPQRLERAAPWLTHEERTLLLRPPVADASLHGVHAWSPADVPLLDEAAELLGEVPRPPAGAGRADQADGGLAEYARGVLGVLEGSRSLDDEEDPELLMAHDLMDPNRLADRHTAEVTLTVAERAAADRTWAYGHVIVDEAQELSEMAWRALMRRCPSRSMTLVGDLAQTGDLGGITSWQRTLDPYLAGRWRLEPLTVNYRMPAEIMAVAADVLEALDLPVTPPRSVRSTGVDPWQLAATADELPGVLARLAAREVAGLADGTVAVIAPDARVAALRRAVLATAASGPAPEAAPGPAPEAVPGEGVPGSAPGGERGPEPDPEPDLDLELRVAVLGVRQAKGLEFDSVIVVDPEEIIAESPRGMSDLYVALTRATQRLGVVYSGKLPTVLAKLRSVGMVCDAEHIAHAGALGPLTRPLAAQIRQS